MTEPEKRLTLRLPPELFAQVEGMADYHLRSVNSEIIYLLQLALTKPEQAELLGALNSILEAVDDVITLKVSHAEGLHQIKRTANRAIAKAEGK